MQTAFILAGEASGDRLGADLMQRVNQTKQVDWIGVGGALMQAEGLSPHFPMSDLSVMGISDVLKRLPLLFLRISQTVKFILKSQPHVVVLIDSQDFSKRVAKRLRAKGYAGAIILYVCPTVWVYAPERATEYAKLFDEVLAILPFEPKVMQELGGPKTIYVGHPTIRRPRPKRTGSVSPPIVALYPGSRAGEIRRHLELLGKTAEKLVTEFGEIEFVMPTISSTQPTIERQITTWPISIKASSDAQWRADKLAVAQMAVVVSGTATLEVAVAGVPMVTAYVMDFAQARKLKKLGNIRMSLPNIILDDDVVPEVFLHSPDVAQLYTPVRDLFRNSELRHQQSNAFVDMINVMQAGQIGEKKQDPENRILQYLS